MNELLRKRYSGQSVAIDFVKEINPYPHAGPLSIETSDTKYPILATSLILEKTPK